MAAQNLSIPFHGLLMWLNRGVQVRPAARIAPDPESALLVPGPQVSSKNYSEERLRADTGRYYQHVGRHMFR